ncbi:MAG: hypothetical protein HKL90_09175 [Elusimicrobia bacterium]|nr:hypothetical protein [Elusimicrobiota bacterium]
MNAKSKSRKSSHRAGQKTHAVRATGRWASAQRPRKTSSAAHEAPEMRTESDIV